MTALEKENKDDPDMGEMIDLELEALSNQLAERLAFGPEWGGGASRTVGALPGGGTIDPPWASLCPLPLHEWFWWRPELPYLGLVRHSISPRARRYSISQVHG